ncbi:MAG TPA: dihydropteroate synthase [Acetobacteraceae bacterium]|jgi:dihydropteroate synthase
MGVLNVTPDSFSDGGDFLDPEVAVAAALEMFADGADIIDVGGESTRPRSRPTPPEVEQARILPVVRRLVAAGVRVSVDTRHATTMEAALNGGASVVNDVSGLAFDARAASLIASRRCPVVLMHMRGEPADMHAHTHYGDVVGAVCRELADRAFRAEAAGVCRHNIVLDPGIGFAKTPGQSMQLLRRLPQVAALGYPVAVGVSRKSFMADVTGEPNPRQRLPGSLAAGLFALSRGATILRVHDVRETVQALRVWQALARAPNPP